MVNSAGLDREVYGPDDPGLGRRVTHYFLPFLLVAITSSVRLFMPSAITVEMSLLVLTLVVLVSARTGGVGPGLLATILGVALESRLSGLAGAPPLFILFAATGFTVSLLTVPLRLTLRRTVRRQRRQMLDALPTFAAILARNGVVEDVNRTALETASLNRQDVIGKQFHTTYWWSHSGALQERLQMVLARCAEGEPVRLEATLRQGPPAVTGFPGGPHRLIPVELSFSLQGEFVMALAQDISDRIAAKNENEGLRERVERSEAVLRSAEKAAGIAVFDWLVQDNEVAWSDELKTFLGFARSGEKPEDWRAMIHPEHRDSVEREIRRLLHNREREYQLEFQVTPAMGGTRWLRGAGEILTLADKRQRMLGVAVDLTRSKQLEAAARESQERYRLLMENAPEIVFTARTDGCWDYVSPAWTRYTGLEGSQAAEEYGWISALHPEDAQSALYCWMDRVEAGKAFALEHRIRSAGGEYRWFLVSSAPARDEEGRVVRWFGVATGIDDQKRAEFAARSREEWYQRADESSGIGSFEWEIKTGRLRCSDEWLRLHRIQPSPAVHLDEWIGSIHIDDRERVRHNLRRSCFESGRADFEYRIEAPDAAVRWINTRATAYVDDEGNPLRVIGSSMDATKRRELEDALRGQQRLESIGILAGGIAHDFNNLLTGIIGNSSLLRERLSSMTPWIDDVLRASERAADLTRQMLAFAGKSRLQTEPVNLSDLAREAQGSVGGSLPKNIHLRMEAASELPSIEADPNQVRLVLTTLIDNAVEAIGENNQGTITVATSVRHISSDNVQIASGSYIALEVRDTGCGMDEATRARIFDPFFTTKFYGRGLGLSAAMGIARGHKGSISVSSVPGEGSTFIVLFPPAGEVPVPQLAAAPPEQLESGHKILVIDDEEVVRNLVKSALERYGYSVLLAEDGDKGVDQFALKPGEVQLVLLDVSMPGLSSEETLQRLMAIRTDVKVLLFSGYSAEDALRRFEGKRLAGFLQKPFTTQALREKVNAVIRADQPAVNCLPSLTAPPPAGAEHNHYPA